MIGKKEAMPSQPLPPPQTPDSLLEEEMQEIAQRYKISKEDIQALINDAVKPEHIDSFLEISQGFDKQEFIKTYHVLEKDLGLFIRLANTAKDDPEKLSEMTKNINKLKNKGMSLSGAIDEVIEKEQS
jgi:hypothetical protein